jgi:pyridinium-3,5-biscarboxylic acid mononucleotide sulfurtransferase
MLEKEILLHRWFLNHKKVLVALSGGVDSCLVAYMARKYLGKENAISVIGVSPSLKAKDLRLSADFCNQFDIKLVEINPDEINDPNYNSNPINRCYFCKSNLYESMYSLQKSNYHEFEILNGNNRSDFGDYRPGLKAAEEYVALSPLAECGLDKQDIRLLAKEYNLPVWDKPASPCLSSRFPYGEKITADRLKMVEKAEDLLNEYGFSDVRVRYFSEIARIEVPAKEVKALSGQMDQLKAKFIELGFRDCEIDEEGLVSGKLNRRLNN